MVTILRLLLFARILYARNGLAGAPHNEVYKMKDLNPVYTTEKMDADPSSKRSGHHIFVHWNDVYQFFFKMGAEPPFFRFGSVDDVYAQ